MYPIIVENTKKRQLAAHLSDSTKTFDIRDHIDKLEPAKEKDRFRCPVCGGGALTVKPSTGAYQCWSGGCSARDIREAISPQSASYSPHRPRTLRRYKQPPTPPPALIPDGEVRLLRLPSPATDCPLPGTPKWVPKGVPAGAEEIVYRYSESQTVHRFQWASADSSKGREKTFRQCHLNEDGLPVWTKGENPWPAYREEEVLGLLRTASHDAVPVALMQEGEGCVEIGRGLALPSLTFQGSAWGPLEVNSLAGKLKEAHPNACLAFLPDNDSAGRKKLAQVEEGCNAAGVPFFPLDPLAICPDLPEKGDVKEILDSLGNSDDFLDRLQAEISRAAGMNQARIEEWEKQFANSGSPAAGTQKAPPKADAVGAEIAEKYRDKLVYCVEFKSWLEYGRKKDGVWALIADEVVDSIVDSTLEAMGVSEIGAIKAYHANVIHKLRCKLLKEEWKQPAHLIPFDDCVYDRVEKKTYEHSPGFELLWKLPHRYRSAGPEMGFPTIDRFLSEAVGGNQEYRQILIHFAAAVLTGRPDLQKFLMLIGPGGTGKDSYTNLLEALVGKENTISMTLGELDDKHERAALMDKRFALFADQGKAPQKLDMFKRLTGQSPMRGRKLFKDGSDFRFMGMAAVTANYPIFYGDSSSAIARRMVVVPFDHTPAVPQDLQKLFQPELGAFTQYLLSISDEDITAVLRPNGAATSREAWKSFIRSDSMAGWINEWVEYDPRAWTQVGGNQAEWRDRDYIPVQSSLYGSYSEWCRRNVGSSPKSKNNFRADVVELCRQVLKWDGVKEKRTNAGMGIQGLRLKLDPGGVTLLEKLCADLGLHGADLSADLKPLPGIACVDRVDRVDLNSISPDVKNNEAPQETPQKEEEETQGLHDPGNPDTEGVSGMRGGQHRVDLEVCTQEDSGNGPAAPAPEPVPAPVTEISPAPAREPAATEPVDWPAIPVSEEIKGWAELLELAEKAEAIRCLADHYRSHYGHDYDTHKKEVWRLLTAGTKERIRQLVAATEPATVTEPAAPAPEGVISIDTPEPLATPAEAETLLTVAQHCLPDAAAGPSLLALAKELRLESNPELWQALAQACSSPVAAPEKEPYSYRSFPHADLNAKEETKRSQARQGRNQILKAKDFLALAAALHRLNPAQRAWVAGNLLTQEIRQNIWEMVRSWCRSKINPQRELF